MPTKSASNWIANKWQALCFVTTDLDLDMSIVSEWWYDISYAAAFLSSLEFDALELLKSGLIVIFLQGSESRPTVVLRAPSSLFVAKVLPSIWSEEAYCVNYASFPITSVGAENLPTCSAFSQLRFIFDWLSGSGKVSSWPAISGTGPLDVK